MANTASARATHCDLCGRRLPRTKDGRLDPGVTFSSHTGNHYCPPRSQDRCLEIRRRNLKRAQKEDA